MSFLDLLSEYKTVIGGFSIAVATVIAVAMNLSYNRRVERQSKREKNASFGSAIASELVDNADNLMELYFQISSPQGKSSKVTGYKEFSVMAYERLLEQIGALGPALSFMVVDVYGDIRKIKTRLNSMSDEDIFAGQDDILTDVQAALIKTITASVTMYLYADYMSGRQWIALIRDQRILWIERRLDDFFQYVDKTDHDVDFVPLDDESDVPFLKRFKDPEKRKHIKSLFEDINETFAQLHHVEAVHAQIMLRALSYTLKNTLVTFLDLEPYEYDLSAEQGYAEIVQKIVKK